MSPSFIFVYGYVSAHKHGYVDIYIWYRHPIYNTEPEIYIEY